MSQHRHLLKGTLNEKAFWSVNKKLAKHLGSNDAALVLSHLLSLQQNVFGNKPFYQQQERIMAECNVTLYGLRNITSLLISEGILTVSKVGMPAKNHYWVEEDMVATLLALDLPDSAGLVSSQETAEQGITDTVSLDLPETGSQEMPISASQRKELIKKDFIENRIDIEENTIGDNIIDIPDSLLSKEQRIIKSQLMFQ